MTKLVFLCEERLFFCYNMITKVLEYEYIIHHKGKLACMDAWKKKRKLRNIPLFIFCMDAWKKKRKLRTIPLFIFFFSQIKF